MLKEYLTGTSLCDPTWFFMGSETKRHHISLSCTSSLQTSDTVEQQHHKHQENIHLLALNLFQLPCLLVALCSLATQAVYISRMSTIRRAPNVFRPGVSLQSLQQRHYGTHPRLMQASHRAPYVLYRSPNAHRQVVQRLNCGPKSNGSKSCNSIGF